MPMCTVFFLAQVDFVSIATAFQSKIEKNGSNEGEFTAFVAYAQVSTPRTS